MENIKIKNNSVQEQKYEDMKIFFKEFEYELITQFN